MNYDKEYYKKSIIPIPELRKEIIDSINQKNLVLFIGAGVSRIMGCKGWSELANELINGCFESNFINYKEKIFLSEKRSPKESISICKHIFKKHDDESQFIEIINKSVKPDKKKLEKFPIYKYMRKMGAAYITTNVDTCFDELYFEKSIIYKPEDLDIEKLDDSRLFHIHGTINDPESMIFTTSDYINHYNNDNVAKFLKLLFAPPNKILFVGYGMGEYEILDYLLSKSSNGIENRHYILLPMYQNDENILEFEEDYYGDMGLNVIPYAIDEKGYGQLYYIIKDWQKKALLSSNFLNSNFEYIESNINNYNDEVKRKIFELIKNHDSLENHFFNRVSSLDWFGPLCTEGYFDANKNPLPIPKENGHSIPYWNVLDYLIKISEKAQNGNNKLIAEKILEIIGLVSKYRDNGEKIDNYLTYHTFIKIMSILILYVEIKHINLIKEYLNSKWRNDLLGSTIVRELIPSLIRHGEKDKLIELIKIITSVKWKDKYNFTPVTNEYWINTAFKSNGEEISRLIPLETAMIAIKQIEEIRLKSPNEFNIVQIPSIESHKDSYDTRLQDILIYVSRDMLNSAIKIEKENTKEFLDQTLNSDIIITKRICLSVIDSNWDKCEDVFWKIIHRDMFSEYDFRNEIYNLLQRHFSSFSTENKSKILSWIDQGPLQVDIYNNEVEQSKWKQRWLESIIHSGYKPAFELYKKCKNVTNKDPEPHEIPFVSEPYWISRSDRSEKFLKEDPKEISENLRNYIKNQDIISKLGIEDALFNDIKENPSKYYNNLNYFIDIHESYQSIIISGFCGAWRQKKDLDWVKIINYCKTIISGYSWNNSINNGGLLEYNKSVIVSIADLIACVTEDDLNFINSRYLSLNEELILEINKYINSDLKYSDNMIDISLNTTKGRVLYALISNTLRFTQVNKQLNKIEEVVTPMLNRITEPSLEWSTLLGYFLPKFSLLNKKWVEKNILKIFPKDEEHWKATMVGYLVSKNVYEFLYNLLSKYEIYNKAVNLNFRNSDIRSRLISHVCMGYLQEKDENLKEYLNLWKSDEIAEIITFFWFNREEILKNSSEEKVFTFWRNVHNTLVKKEYLTEEDKKLLSNINKLSCFIGEINEEKLLWLKFSIEFIGSEYSFILEDLNRLVEHNPDEIGDIYLKIMENEYIPNYEQDKIRNIIETLYIKDQKNIANKISNIYLNKGYEFLRDIYKKYN